MLIKFETCGYLTQHFITVAWWIISLRGIMNSTYSVSTYTYLTFTIVDIRYQHGKLPKNWCRDIAEFMSKFIKHV